MSIPNAHTLRQSTKIAAKIELLIGKLHALVGDTLVLPVDAYTPPAQTVKIPRPRGRPPGSVNKSSGTPSKDCRHTPVAKVMVTWGDEELWASRVVPRANARNKSGRNLIKRLSLTHGF